MANSTSINLQSKTNFLEFDVRYSIQVFAENIYGRGKGSEVVNFTRSSGKWYKHELNVSNDELCYLHLFGTNTCRMLAMIRSLIDGQ